MPPHNTVRQPLSSVDGKIVFQRFKQVLSTTEGITVIRECPTPDGVTMGLAATGNTWSRAARRKKLKASSSDTSQQTTLPPVKLVCQATLSHKLLEFNWVRGRDRTLFESLCSHISRKVALEPSS